jgi:hypothetical protein
MNLYKSLFEAPITAMDPEDEPPRPKPTKTKPKDDPFDFLNDIGDIGGTNNKNLPSGPIDAQGDTPNSDQGTSGGPEIRRADGDTTRSRLSGMRPNDQMRDMLNRIDMNQDDEIDDAEAARRAGLGGAERPEPGQRFEVDRVRPADVPMVLNNQLRAAGEQMPEWHTINNLPGYMQRAIRGMGRQMFGMMTRTPLEQIMTIANVNGQGPNTDAEMRAVAAYLVQNGQDLGPVQIGFGQAIPGYEPDVREYTAMGMRFHVVRDQMGQYIYAYPEQDARTPGAQGRLPGGGNNTPRLNRESRMINNIKTPVAESVQKHLAESLTLHKTRALLESKLLEDLESYLLNESTLSKLIGDQPGGQPIVRWMHGRYLLSNTAEWYEHKFSDRVFWTEFKNNPDQFLIVVGANGTAGIKPSLESYKKGEASAARRNKVYNPSKDNTIKYQIIAFLRDQQIDPDLLRAPDDVDRDVDPTIMKTRGGMVDKRDTKDFNIFDGLRDQIGTLHTVIFSKSRATNIKKRDAKDFTKGYQARSGIVGEPGAIERDKIATRRPVSVPGDQEDHLSKFKNKIKPIMKKLLRRVGNLALMDVKEEAQDAFAAGAYDRARNWGFVAEKIEKILMAINKQGNIDLDSRYGNPLNSLITASITDAARSKGQDLELYLQMLNSTPGTEKLKPFMDALRSNLIKAGT